MENLLCHCENRSFQSIWTEKYMIILLKLTGFKPLCLLYNGSIAVLKQYNLKTHCSTSPGSFSAHIPLESLGKRDKKYRVC